MIDTAAVILTALASRWAARRWRGQRPGLAALLAALGGGGVMALVLPADQALAAELARAVLAATAGAATAFAAAIFTPRAAR